MTETSYPTRDVQYETEGERPNRVVTQRTKGETTLMMTEIEEGVFVGWDHCANCGASVAECKCHGGPVEKGYIAQWRQERLDKLRPGFTLPTTPKPFDDSKLSETEFGRLEELELKAAGLFLEINEMPDDSDLPEDFNATEFLDPTEADELRALWAKGEMATDEAIIAAKARSPLDAEQVAHARESIANHQAAKVDSGLDAAKAAVESARTDPASIDPGF